MARLLPIYPELPSVPVESTEPVDYNPQCSRCPLSAGVKTVCMKAEYIPAPSGPTLLVVVD